MKRQLLKLGTTLALAFSFAVAAQAALVPVYDTDPGGDDPGIPAGSKAQAAANSLKSRLIAGTERVESFESYTPGVAPPANLTFRGSNGTGDLTASRSGGGLVDNKPFSSADDSFLGRFNTTAGGENFVETSESFGFTMNNGASFSAFGVYLTDFGDFDSIFEIYLTDVDGNRTLFDYLENSAANEAVGNGSLEFIGFYDDQNAYRRIEFVVTQNTQGLTDFLGFDDLFIGDVERRDGNTVPEPGSLALVGLSLLGLAAARRRQSRA